MTIAGTVATPADGRSCRRSSLSRWQRTEASDSVKRRTAAGVRAYRYRPAVPTEGCGRLSDPGTGRVLTWPFRQSGGPLNRSARTPSGFRGDNSASPVPAAERLWSRSSPRTRSLSRGPPRPPLRNGHNLVTQSSVDRRPGTVAPPSWFPTEPVCDWCQVAPLPVRPVASRGNAHGTGTCCSTTLNVAGRLRGRRSPRRTNRSSFPGRRGCRWLRRGVSASHRRSTGSNEVSLVDVTRIRGGRHTRQGSGALDVTAGCTNAGRPVVSVPAADRDGDGFIALLADVSVMGTADQTVQHPLASFRASVTEQGGLGTQHEH